MPSEVDICNLALQRLGAQSISSLDDDNTRAIECKRVYPHARDSEIRAHPFSFARARAAIAADNEAPAFGYAKRYRLPENCLRILPTKTQADLQIEGDFILTDLGAPLNLVYLKQITDPNSFDQGFIDLLVARIANDLAEKLTQSNKKKEAAAAGYKLAKSEARRVNAFERPPLEAPEDPWVTARR